MEQKTQAASRIKVKGQFHKIAGMMLIFLSLITLCTNAGAVTYEWEHQSKYMTSGVYGWVSSYDIGFYNDTLMVDVDIYLAGYTPADTLKSRWESGIESIWSTSRFTVPISFNVDWVTTGYDYVVNVTNSTGRWNMLNWYTIGAGGWGDAYQEEVAAHEYGHMIGEWDEYAEGAVDPETQLINTGGIMHTLNGGTLDHYYADFLAWYDNKLNSVPVIEPDPIIPKPIKIKIKPSRVKEPPTDVPEPNILLLLGLGMVGLAGVSRKVQKQRNATTV
jgi:hypothetical protein